MATKVTLNVRVKQVDIDPTPEPWTDEETQEAVEEVTELLRFFLQLKPEDECEVTVELEPVAEAEAV
jgi:hypothetical protein